MKHRKYFNHPNKRFMIEHENEFLEAKASAFVHATRFMFKVFSDD